MKHKRLCRLHAAVRRLNELVGVAMAAADDLANGEDLTHADSDLFDVVHRIERDLAQARYDLVRFGLERLEQLSRTDRVQA